MFRFLRQSVAAPLLALLVSFPSGSVAHACSCAPNEPPTAALDRAGAVFAGRVAVLEQPGGTLIDVMSMEPMTLRFDVDRTWKGPVSRSLTVKTAPNGAVCGYAFQTSEEYLVYALATEADLWVSLCSRTIPLAQAAEDLAALGPGEVPSEDPGVDGSLDLAALAVILAGLLPVAAVSAGIIVKRRRAPA